MAMSFIGKPISLISHSDVRYRGILAGIDPANSTIQLQNVFSMGTENRRPPAEFIPPAEQPYQYIIFRASEVKDLAVDPVDPPPQRNLHDDPAIIGASAPAPNANYGSYPAQYPNAPPAQPQPQQMTRQQQQQQSVPASLGTRPPPSSTRGPEPGAASSPPAGSATAGVNGAPSEERTASRASANSRRGGSMSVHSAAASLQTVERALGDLRISNAANGQRGGGGGGRRNAGGRRQEIEVPATDFDFVGSNARFEKPAHTSTAKSSDERTNPSDDGKEEETPTKDAEEKEREAYNPKKSFFDQLSSNNAPPPPSSGGRGGPGRRGGHGRNRREEEREKNVATFGEPGGVGLMGPGAYVPGWGGYGRRGGRGRGGGRGAGIPAGRS